MKKMRLDIDVLEVESFDTGYVRRIGIGTVRGRGLSENPCASENASCNCTLQFGVEGCDTQADGCGQGGGTWATCPEGQQTCQGGCSFAYACSGYCGTAGGTCAIQSCELSVCYGNYEGSECACAQSQRGSCYAQDTCKTECLQQGGGHSGGWCTPYCGTGHASCAQIECIEPTAGGC